MTSKNAKINRFWTTSFESEVRNAQDFHAFMNDFMAWFKARYDNNSDQQAGNNLFWTFTVDNRQKMYATKIKLHDTLTKLHKLMYKLTHRNGLSEKDYLDFDETLTIVASHVHSMHSRAANGLRIQQEETSGFTWKPQEDFSHEESAEINTQEFLGGIEPQLRYFSEGLEAMKEEIRLRFRPKNLRGFNAWTPPPNDSRYL